MLRRFRCLLTVFVVVTAFGACSSPDDVEKPETIEVSRRAISLESGLVGFWSFDDVSGSIATDSSGFGHNAAIEGSGSHTWTNGKVGVTSLKLAGGRYARVTPTSNLDLPTSEISISGWVFRDTAAVGDEYVMYRRNSSIGSVFHLLQGPSGAVCFSINGNQVCTSPLSIGAWHHIVATWDGSQKRIYADGVLAAENATAATLSYSSSYSLFVGSNQGGAFSWKGQLDDLRLHHRALSATDARSLFTQRSPAQYPAGRALFVVGETLLSPSDAALKAKLERMGFEVSVVDDTASVEADAVGKQLVFISETCQSNQLLTPTGSGPVTSKFKSVVTPIVISEVAAWDDLGMTGTTWGTDFGDSNSESQLNVRNNSVFASGLSGITTVSLAPTKAVWGRPGAQAIVGATLASDSTKVSLFGYEAGSTLPGGFTAAGRRVGVFPGRDAPAYLRDNGWALLESAIRWAVRTPILFVVGPVSATDFTSLSVSDNNIKTALERMGLAVTVKVARAGNPALSSDATGVKAIVVSESVTSSHVLSAYRGVAIPVLTMEPSIADDLNLTGTVWNSDFGDAADQTELDINLPNDPMAAGLQGRIVATTNPRKYVWGRPGVNARKVVTIAGDPTRSAIFLYSKGDQMVGFEAPANRVFFYTGSDAAQSVTPTAWALFYAAMRGALGSELSPFFPYPGEACRIDNGDGTFDAVFSYSNAGASNLEVPIGGSANAISPFPIDRGQPTWFESGVHAFRVRGLTQNTSWTLSGEVRTVTPSTSLCAAFRDPQENLYVYTSTGVRLGVGIDIRTQLETGIIATNQIGGQTVGEQGSGVSVSHSGVARYSIPLQVPPGHHTPSLSINYNHRRGNGALGVGWALSGLSEIRRCPRTQAVPRTPFEFSEPVVGGSNQATYDLCLDGEPLEAVYNQAIAPRATEYFLETDSRYTITVTESDDLGPKSILVRDGNGNVMTYGSPNAYPCDTCLLEGVLVDGANGRLGWALNRSEDVFGNAYAVTYLKMNRPSDNAVEQLPATISYVRENGGPVLRRIVFSYEARSDTREAFARGFKTTLTQRLSKIEMFAPNPYASGIVRSYRLGYLQGLTITGRSLLSSVTECDVAGVCMAPLQMDYEPGSYVWNEAPQPITVLTNQINTPEGFILPMDANGDGLEDILYRTRSESGAAVWNISFSQGSSFGPPRSVPGLPTGVSGQAVYAPVAIDIDGKGADHVGIVDPASTKVTYWKHVGPAFSTEVFTSSASGLSHYIADMDGDGLPDALERTSNGDWRPRRNDPNNPGSFLSPSGVAFVSSNITNAFLSDMDGDGAAELLAAPQVAGNPYAPYDLISRVFSSVTTKQSTLPQSVNARGGVRYNFADFNGDGLPDAVWTFNDFLARGFVSQPNPGNGFPGQGELENASEFPLPSLFANDIPLDAGIRVTDVNLDGRQDLLILATAGRNFWANIRNPDPAVPSFREVSSIPTGLGTSSKGMVLSKLLDANGDGLSDVVQYVNGAIRLYLRESKKPDLLVKVSGGKRPVTEISYLPASNSAVHTPDYFDPSCSYPQQCVKGGPWLVREVKTDDGVGGKRVEQHRFDGLRASILYGDLGPASHTVIDLQTGNELIFEMDNRTAVSKLGLRQLYPFANLVKNETFKSGLLAGGKRIVRIRSIVYGDISGNGRRMMRAEEDCDRTYETNNAAGIPSNSDEISESCATLGYDEFGNAHTYSRTNGRGDRITTLSNFENWSNPRVLGVLKHRTVIGYVSADATSNARQTLKETRFEPDAFGQIRQIIVEPNATGANVSQSLTRTLVRNSRGQVVETIDSGRVTAPRPDGVVVEQSDQTRRSTIAYDTLDGVFPTLTRNAKGTLHATTFILDLAFLLPQKTRTASLLVRVTMVSVDFEAEVVREKGT